MSDEQKHALLELGLCEVLIPLTSSANVEVQGHSAAALSNLTSMGIVLVFIVDFQPAIIPTLSMLGRRRGTVCVDSC